MLKLAQIIPEHAIVPDLRGRTREEIVAELLDALVRCGAVAAELAADLGARVLERERKGSTGFGKGVAVPHVKHRSIERMCGAIGLSRLGVDFNALDRAPVFTFVLLISPDSRPEDHLRAMEVIFKNLSKETFRRFLRQASSAQGVAALLEEADQSQLTG
ncbi:MAG: PTS sugar transporter subunit IIA [Phycisphaerae bacterium]|nr:PTS sugar transporter subunit IIA [Phycisphaerae bacterium]